MEARKAWHVDGDEIVFDDAGGGKKRLITLVLSGGKMRLRVRPMGLPDVENCVALLASHPEEQRRYGAVLEGLPGAWRKLMWAGALNARVVEDIEAGEPQLVAFGASVFVREDVLRRLKTAPLVWIGPELVCRTLGSGGGILSPKEIRDANSAAGLSLVVWAGVVSAPAPNEKIHTELWRAFFEAHVGYHISELICQPLDSGQVQATIQAGLSWLSGEGHYVDGRSQPWEQLVGNAFILGGDQQLASQHFGSWISALLSYTPPRIYFRPAEQRLLLAALSGLTDEELSNQLAVSRSAVKKTWGVVYERAAAALPGEFPNTAAGNAESKRGKEKKQHLLAYLRGQMEELRPVLPPRSRTHPCVDRSADAADTSSCATPRSDTPVAKTWRRLPVHRAETRLGACAADSGEKSGLA